MADEEQAAAPEGEAVEQQPETMEDALFEDSSDLNLEAVYDVPVQISVVLGKTTMPISQLLKMGDGAVIELERKVGENVDVYVNNRMVARGEVVIVEERIGITMTEIIKDSGGNAP